MMSSIGLPASRSMPVGDWPKFLVPSIAIYFGGLAVLVLTNVIHAIRITIRSRRDANSASLLYASSAGSPDPAAAAAAAAAASATAPISPNAAHQRSLMTKYRIRDRVDEFVNGHNLPGRLQLVVVFGLSLASFALYLIDASWSAAGVPIKYSIIWRKHTTLLIDFGFNMVFLLHFILRFLSATDKLGTWLTWQTLVDVATIPTCFTYMVENEYWCALRFSRVMYLTMVPELLEAAGVLADSGRIRLVQLSVQFTSLWFVSAGFIHLLENSGDPWEKVFNGQQLAYWQCVYYLIVTSSTVGYGDITCRTVLGQAFVCGYIFVGLAMFANALPEVVNILQFASPFKGRIIVTKARRHVLVCGCTTVEAAKKFTSIFLHPDWGLSNVTLVFINTEMPGVEFQAFLKRQKNVLYICGDEMNAYDLSRAAIGSTESCIILANQAADDPDNEDKANLMRAVAIKNANGKIRILIQLLLQQNKQHSCTIPNWNSCDVALCLDELKMGIIATNCWAPGFCTFMSLVIRQYGLSDILSSDQDNTMAAYARGSGMEVYEGDLSSDFIGMQFAQAADLCFTRLKLLMFAIKSSGKILINPGRHYIITKDDRAFFIAESVQILERAFNFCKKCHETCDVKELSRCGCKWRDERQDHYDRMNADLSAMSDEETSECRRLQNLLNNEKRRGSYFDCQVECEVIAAEEDAETAAHFDASSQLLPNEQPKVRAILSPMKFDSIMIQTFMPGNSSKNGSLKELSVAAERFDFTGTFYWCEPRRIEQACLTIDEARSMNFKKHVVLCVFGNHSCARLGLRNFVMPLRASNRSPEELMCIVIVGDPQYIANEWPEVCTFPDIYILAASPMRRNVLRAVNLEKCSMCVIVTARGGRENRTLMDKHAILCYLSIKSMKFGSDDDSTDSTKNLNQSLSLSQTKHLDLPTITIRMPIMYPFGHKPILFRTASQKKAPLSAAPRIANNIPVLVDIALPENILILDDDITHTTDTPLVLLNPFACGSVCAGDLLDSFTCTAYYNPGSVKLIRHLVTGGCTNEVDKILEENLEWCEGKSHEVSLNRNRTRVSEISLFDPRYSSYGVRNCTYAELFVELLHEEGCICVAVCRLREADCGTPKSATDQRLVLVNPPESLKLRMTDKVICLQPFSV